ncbi:response regulator [Synoicihabitans lomoniglobus]|uniref:Response regulator n=1 Tax=Synoicihabitans lomoniglobus TaxID=2909285 RepID=A0AAE9ZZM7_9BACT|nr:response regulator [Opitutaceae bacterium LMO-M01]WED63562.1 response regulator [Opitutaceae bacterium LMO-M01]
MPHALLIEDNAANQHLATFLLKRAGFTVTVAENGLLGYNSALELRPDVIVLDIEMPVMDGYETFKKLHADPVTHDIPVLVATSYAMPGERNQALELGVHDYLEKPYEPEEFIRRVKLLFDPAS